MPFGVISPILYIRKRGAGGIKGTWFGKSQVDIETNFFLVYIYLSDTLFTYKYVENELGLSKTTINDWCSFVREVVLHWVLGNKSKIGGVGTTVEIDESKFGKRKYNVGRLVTGQWVFGGICRETREFFCCPSRKSGIKEKNYQHI